MCKCVCLLVARHSQNPLRKQNQIEIKDHGRRTSIRNQWWGHIDRKFIAVYWYANENVQVEVVAIIVILARNVCMSVYAAAFADQAVSASESWPSKQTHKHTHRHSKCQCMYCVVLARKRLERRGVSWHNTGKRQLAAGICANLMNFNEL